MPRRLPSPILAALALAACAPPAGGPSSAALGAAQDTPVVLDARADGTALVGRVEPVRPGTDPDRVVQLDDARVLDARFAAGGVVILDAEHVLRFVTERAERELDRDAWGPLTVAGDTVAYTRGAPPDLELARASLATGATELLTTGMAPVWSPALSDDGAEIVFVSGVEGTPRLHRLDRDGAVVTLAIAPRIPSAPTAPRWQGDTLLFEDELGIVWLDLERGAIVRELQGVHGLAQRGDRLVASLDGREIELGGAR